MYQVWYPFAHYVQNHQRHNTTDEDIRAVNVPSSPLNAVAGHNNDKSTSDDDDYLEEKCAEPTEACVDDHDCFECLVKLASDETCDDNVLTCPEYNDYLCCALGDSSCSDHPLLLTFIGASREQSCLLNSRYSTVHNPITIAWTRGGTGRGARRVLICYYWFNFGRREIAAPLTS